MIQSWPCLVEGPWQNLPAFLAAMEQGHDHPEVGGGPPAKDITGKPGPVEQTLKQQMQDFVLITI
jgi:hypothetical protein